jgi:hypothetical protein
MSIRRAAALVPLLAALLAIAPATAQPIVPPRQDDEVTLTLRAEAYVETVTASVTVAFDTALEGAGMATMRDTLNKILAGLAADSSWRFTRFDRVVDPAGLERWRVAAEARLPESALAGLADKAKAASRPGIQVHLDSVDFSPTLAERETGYASLRAELYRQAEGELARLKSAVADRPYRIKRVSFQEDGSVPQPPRPLASMQMRAEMAPADAGSGFAAAEPAAARHIGLTALVTLGATAP